MVEDPLRKWQVAKSKFRYTPVSFKKLRRGFIGSRLYLGIRFFLDLQLGSSWYSSSNSADKRMGGYKGIY